MRATNHVQDNCTHKTEGDKALLFCFPFSLLGFHWASSISITLSSMKLENWGHDFFQIFSVLLLSFLCFCDLNEIYFIYRYYPASVCSLCFFSIHFLIVLRLTYFSWLIFTFFCNLHSGVIFGARFKPQMLYFPVFSCWKFLAFHSLLPVFLSSIA